MGLLGKAILKQALSGLRDHLSESTNESLITGYKNATSDYERNPNEHLRMVIEIIGGELKNRGINPETLLGDGKC